MNVLMIRHSQTPGNREGRYIGRSDQPLAPEAMALAERLGGDPAVKTVYVTPLIRTRQTAAILFPNARQIVVDALREMDFGDFEGKNAAELEGDPAYRAWVDGGCLSPCPGGEGREGFSDRVCGGFLEVMARAQGERAVFVVHGGTIMAVLERFARPRQDFYAWHVENCQGWLCGWTADGRGRGLLTGCQPWGAQ